MKNVRRADIFDVWGWPPSLVTVNLTTRQLNALRRYVGKVVGNTYRIAYDAGRAALKEQK